MIDFTIHHKKEPLNKVVAVELPMNADNLSDLLHELGYEPPEKLKVKSIIRGSEILDDKKIYLLALMAACLIIFAIVVSVLDSRGINSNKLTKTVAPFDNRNSEVVNEYDKNGNLVKTIQNLDNNKNSVTVNKYNAMGLLEKVVLGDGTVNGEKNITKYFYNNAGIQTKMYTGMSSENDGTYLTTEYEYDSFMRLIRTTDSTGYNSGTIAYDLNGNVLTSTDANGNITTNTYDALNRVLTANSVNPDDSSKNVSKSYQYDEMSRTVRTTVNNKSTTYLYDDLGRVYQEEGYNSFKGYRYAGISQYPTYECSGIFNKIIYYEKNYEYDNEMRISSLQESENDIVSYTYDANGNKKSETLENGVVSTYTYNKANRITKLEKKLGNNTISSYDYSYYLDGSDACKVRSENGIIETTEYEYDSLKRLVEESVTTGNYTDTYTYEYDDYGNRSKMTAGGSENYVTEYVYNDTQGNYTTLLQKEIKTVQGENNNLNNNYDVKQTVYTYDANGNQITKTTSEKTETNTYDALNQLVGFTDGTATASYTYGVSGLRDSKTVNGVTTTHIWIGSQVVVDYTTHYTATVYIRGTSLAAAFDWDEGSKGDNRFYTQNAHGDVVNITDADGTVINSYTYDAFGVEKNISDSDTNIFRYCGEYYDAETGTIYLRARYYDPTIGRFISRDSVSGENTDPLSLNLYTYCQNNPVQFVDENGHWPKLSTVLKAVAVVAVTVAVVAVVVAAAPVAAAAITAATSAVAVGGGTMAAGAAGASAVAAATAAASSSAVVTATTVAAYASATALTAGATAYGAKHIEDSFGNNITYYKEHTNNARPSTKSKHEKGQTRKNRDSGGEKGDARRTPNPNKRPKNQPKPQKRPKK